MKRLNGQAHLEDEDMTFWSKLEKKFGRYAIPDLTRYIIIGYVVGYLLYMFAPKILGALVLNPALVMRGQVWRLVTWIITPPSEPSLFTLVFLLFYYYMGTMLERTMGRFLYNVYMLGGMLITTVGIMIVYLFCESVFHMNMAELTIGGIFNVSTYYVCLSIFLAIAACYPNMTVYYMLILPIKMKYLAIFYVVMVAYYCKMENVLGRVNIALSLLSFLIFFFSTRSFRRLSPGQIKRKKEYKKQIRMHKDENVIHRCAVCGITNEDAPDLQFRYCSKCKGNKEYCQEHLFTHTHV